MRYITISEATYKACKELGDYSGGTTLMKLAQSAFDGDVEVGDIDKENRAVFIALHDEIDGSLSDDDDRMWPCKPPIGVAHIGVMPKLDEDAVDHLFDHLCDMLKDDDD